MTDIPIIFSAPMVQALLAGRKTQTRRLAWRTRWNEGGHIPDGGGGQMDYVEPHEERIGPTPWQKVKPGDRLWVRETWRADCPDDPTGAIYRADEAHRMPEGGKWVPGIHMPRWASRLTLEVTATKIEPLQKISEADALAEGIICYEPDDIDDAEYAYEEGGMIYASAAEAYKYLWIKLHGADSWNANPEVVALTFEVHKQNIDAMKEAA